jgi:hypothetical protein
MFSWKQHAKAALALAAPPAAADTQAVAVLAPPSLADEYALLSGLVRVTAVRADTLSVSAACLRLRKETQPP